MRKPRTFSHRPIFFDERHERLKEMEERVRHRNESKSMLNMQQLILLIVLLLLIWKLLL